MADTGESILAEIALAGAKVREVKGTVSKEELAPYLATLLGLKTKYKEVTGEDVPGAKPSSSKKKKKGKGDAPAPAPAPAQPKKEKKEKPKETKVEPEKTKAAPSKPQTTARAPTPVATNSANDGMYAAPNAYGKAWNVEVKDEMYPVKSFYADIENPPLPKFCSDTIVSGSSSSVEDPAMQRLGSLITTLQQQIKRAEELIKAHGGHVDSVTEETGVFIGKHGEEVPRKWKRNPSAKLELTVSAHPEKVTPALLVIVELLRAQGVTIDVREYWQCCNGQAPKFPSAEKLQQLRLQQRVQCQMRINFIWKDVERPALVVSAAQHTPIEGESNIIKYICRELSPSLYPTEFAKALKVDSLIDLGDMMFASSKNQKVAMKKPNALLGETKAYVSGDELSLADVYLWSCIVKSEASPAGNVKKWKAMLDDHPSFAKGMASFTALC